ncbi:MAG: hypothetical protein NTU61_06530 [Candidatus Altiarchaeota archaeon]|nr:hypothetical protein [Candidatus Altiarchaeota archaeon]
MKVNTHLGQLEVLKEDVLVLSDFVVSFKDDGLDHRLEIRDRTGRYNHNVYAISREDAERIGREYCIPVLKERATVDKEVHTFTVVKKLEIKDAVNPPAGKKGLLNWM